MTIYKPAAKTEEKKDLVDCDFNVDFTPPEKKDAKEPMPLAPLRKRKRSRTTVAVASALCLLFVCCAVGGSVVLYLKLRHNRMRGMCGVSFMPNNGYFEEDTQGKITAKPAVECSTADYFEEDIVIDEDAQTEKITVPRYHSNDSVEFIHDFVVGMTAIKDITEQVCYVVSMKDAPVPSWRNLRELLRNTMSGAYKVNAGLVRRNFRVVSPMIEDTTTVGWFISEECFPLPMYMLTKINPRPLTITFNITFTVYHGDPMISQYMITK